MKAWLLRVPLHDFSQNPISNVDIFQHQYTVFMKKRKKNKQLTTIILFVNGCTSIQ
jgi:hypothetical protein